jgi:hypothetical protein
MLKTAANVPRALNECCLWRTLQVAGPDIPVKAALQAAAARCGPIDFSPENVKLLDDLQHVSSKMIAVSI